MRGYELTERGKRLIVLIIAFLLLIPSVIIIVKAVSRPDAEDPPVISPAVSPADSPGGDTASPDVTGAEPSASPGASAVPGASEPPDSSEPPPEQKEPPAEPQLSGKTLTFSFSPGSQTQLDDKTAALLGDFLKIPDYLPNYLIIIETLTLPQDAADALMRAVEDAFARYGVKKSQLEHVSRSESEQGETVDVKMLFVSLLEK